MFLLTIHFTSCLFCHGGNLILNDLGVYNWQSHGRPLPSKVWRIFHLGHIRLVGDQKRFKGIHLATAHRTKGLGGQKQKTSFESILAKYLRAARRPLVHHFFNNEQQFSSKNEGAVSLECFRVISEHVLTIYVLNTLCSEIF